MKAPLRSFNLNRKEQSCDPLTCDREMKVVKLLGKGRLILVKSDIAFISRIQTH